MRDLYVKVKVTNGVITKLVLTQSVYIQLNPNKKLKGTM